MTTKLISLILCAGSAFAGSLAQIPATHYSEGRKHAMIRRLAGVAACGLSMWDMAQTAKHTGVGGIVEANSLLAGSGGRANLGTMAGLKIGTCVAPFVIGELGAHWHSSALTNLGLVGSIGSAAVSGAVVMHNQSVLARQAKLMPGTLAGK